MWRSSPRSERARRSRGPAVQAIIAINVAVGRGQRGLLLSGFVAPTVARLCVRDRAGGRGRRVRRAAVHRPAPAGRRRRRERVTPRRSLQECAVGIAASTAHFAVWASRLITCRFGNPQNAQQRRPVHVAMLAPHPEQRHAMVDFRGLPQPPAGLGAAAPLQAADQLGVVARRVPQPPRRDAGGVPGGVLVRPALPQVLVPAEPIDRLAADAAETRARARTPFRETARAARGSSPADRSCALPSAARSSPPACRCGARARAPAGRRATDARASSRRPQAAASAASSAG